MCGACYKAKYYDQWFANYILKKYGLTTEQYLQMVSDQDGLCALGCGRKATKIDHCHETGRVRGLLCHPCNVGLGHYEVLIKREEIVKVYLEKKDGMM